MMLFGRITYQMMASWWPSPQAMKAMPLVAERMNSARKVVFSRTLKEATWSNTTLVKDDLVATVQDLKQTAGKNMLIFGSSTIVSQLARKGLIDEYQLVVNPLVLGRGRTMFETLTQPLKLKHTQTRTFGNGNVFLCYEPAK